jgi:hypothetical protein
VAVDDTQFQSLLEQVRELHRRADEITRDSSRTRENIRARLQWDQSPPSLPDEQRKIADEVVEALTRSRLSAAQSRRLYREFFGK